MLPDEYKEFKKLKKYITDPKGIEQFEKVRKNYRNKINFCNRLYLFFTNALDGVEPEENAKECKLM